MFPTPKEAALQAENDRLKAENAWLRKHVETHDAKVTPYGMETDMVLTRPIEQLVLPRRASISGHRDIDRWEVVATYDRTDGRTLRVDYFVTEPMRANKDDLAFINYTLPRMHERFIHQLGDLFAREHNP